MKIKSIRHDTNGAAFIIVALALTAVFVLIMLAIDLTKSQSAMEDGQGAVDSSVLATADLIYDNFLDTGQMILSSEIKNYAKTVYKQNFSINNNPAKFLDADFKVSMKQNTEDNSYTISVYACSETTNSLSLAPDSKTKECATSAAKVGGEGDKVEVSIAVDNSATMLDKISGTSTVRLDAAKSVLKLFSDKVKKDSATYKPNLTVSIFPYSDTVKLTNNSANPNLLSASNSWLRTPFSPHTNFNGCMGLHENSSYDVVDDAPTNSATKYNPFFGSSKIKTTATTWNGQVTNKSFEPGSPLIIDAPDTYINGTGGDRYANEIEFTASKTDSFAIDLGSAYTNVMSGADISLFAKYDKKNCGNNASGSSEEGRVTFYDNNHNKITHHDFTGVACSAALTVNLKDVSTGKPFRYVEFTAVDNGGNYNGNDNSDYLLKAVTFPFNCGVQPSVVITNNKTAIDSKIAQLSADGPTKTNVGMAWAWRALSPKFARFWDSSKPNLPATYDAAQKYMIVLTQGKNFSAADDAEQLTLCSNIKNAGIKLYYITFDAAGLTQNLGQQCASDGAYFNAPDTATLTKAFDSIANELIVPNPSAKLAK